MLKLRSDIISPWAQNSLNILRAEARRTGDTHMRIFPLPQEWNIDLYLKDESALPTGSLKHRVARALIEDALRLGKITEDTILVEASSGSTAVSEAYFARLLGLRFVAVVPEKTSPRKLETIASYGGEIHPVHDPSEVYRIAENLGAQPNWYYVNQFANASSIHHHSEDGTSLVGSIFHQLGYERFPIPKWVVVGAGTGGTSAGISEYCRTKKHDTQVAVVDPDGSVFYEAWKTGQRDLKGIGSNIEGIGRPRVEPAFQPDLIDHMIRVTDNQSIAGMQILSKIMGIDAGPSTGTNLYGALQLAKQMRERNEQGSIVTLVCDSADRYHDTYYDSDWLRLMGFNPDSTEAELNNLLGQ